MSALLCSETGAMLGTVETARRHLERCQACRAIIPPSRLPQTRMRRDDERTRAIAQAGVEARRRNREERQRQAATQATTPAPAPDTTASP